MGFGPFLITENLNKLNSQNLNFFGRDLILIIVFLLTLIFLLITLYLILKTCLNVYTFLNSKQNENRFLEIILPTSITKSAFATSQIFAQIHSLTLGRNSFLGIKYGLKTLYSMEIVSTKKKGIRYVIVTQNKNIEITKRILISFLPEIKINEIEDYLTEANENNFKNKIKVIELKLHSDFAFPLKNQKTLNEHDFASYLTGEMTKLKDNELSALQIVISPISKNNFGIISNHIRNLEINLKLGREIVPLLRTKTNNPIFRILIYIFAVLKLILEQLFKLIISIPLLILDSSGKSVPILQKNNILNPFSPYELEVRSIVKEKIDQNLFCVSLKLLVISNSVKELKNRERGIYSSFASFSNSFQGIIIKRKMFPKYDSYFTLRKFKKREISNSIIDTNKTVLSISELSDIYHFPNTDSTKTEDIIKSLSPEFPAPLILKSGRILDAYFAKNTYGNSETYIGLTDEERSRHVYLIGRTGSGKSTIIYHMAKEDIQKGRGVCVIDPHGDLAESLLNTVNENRINDVIYFNPFDLKFPIGINLLELPQNLEGDELELEKELVCESVISVFRRIFAKEENTNAHRIEYILRNTIYTSFAVPDRTFFTIYKLLTNKKFRDGIVKSLDDQDLKDFWNNEFGKASNWQIVKMISGVTAKIGRFIYSPITKRIIDQPKSTINFDQILNEGKILICNLSEGKIGEDTSQLLGLTIIAKVHQAALRRSRKYSSERKPFYLFVDEFQNFATTSFTKILSGGRKFGLSLTLAEQSSAQQNDTQVINIILANTGTVICFATASIQDAQMMESQFSPLITRNNLTNLPKYHFYIKMSATIPQEPFSGETLPIDVVFDSKKIKRIIDTSRQNYAIEFVKQTKEQIKETVKFDTQKVNKKTQSKHFIPDEKEE